MTDTTIQPEGPQDHLHAILDRGDYQIVFRRESGDQRVRSHPEIDAAYAGDIDHSLILHRPRHVFLRTDVLGDRLRIDGSEATLDVDGRSVVMQDVEAVDEELDDTVIARVAADEEDDAYSLSTHPSVSSDGDSDAGVSAVHGFRFWNHIAWFADVNQAGPTFEHAPNGLGAPPPGDPAGAAIGLLDTGVRTDHPWMGDVVTELPQDLVSHPHDDKPEYPHHGTMVAGMIRQAAPASPIQSYRVTLGVDHVSDERIIIGGLRAIRKLRPAVTIVVMAFGGETIPAPGSSGAPPLLRAIRRYLRAGDGRTNHVFAAAGNLYIPTASTDQRNRMKVYPAAWPGVTAVAGGDENGLYHWSNGWGTEKWPPVQTPPTSGQNRKLVAVTNGARERGFLYTAYGMDDTTPMYAYARGTSLLTAIEAGVAAGGSNPFPARV